jgi:dehydrogenase/reductase SDR family member 1
MADLKGTIALVTHGSCESGQGIAEGLAEAGASVYISAAGNDPSAHRSVGAVAQRVNELGGRGIPLPVDPQDEQSVGTLIAQIEKSEGRLDLLINNGAVPFQPATRLANFWQQSISAWEDQCRSSLQLAYAAAICAVRLMVKSQRGLIINVCADAAAEQQRSTACAVVRAGLERMVHEMARELSGHQITAVALRPGMLRTQALIDALGSGSVKAELKPVQSPRFIGRCIAALAMDPDVAEKSGGSYQVATLAQEYRFTDPQLQEC